MLVLTRRTQLGAGLLYGSILRPVPSKSNAARFSNLQAAAASFMKYAG